MSGVIVLAVLLALPTAAGASLATLSLAASRARPGATVTLTGASFVLPRPGTGLEPTQVVIRWQSEDGPILAQATPDRFGSISATFTVPADARPGMYILIGTQLTPRRAPDAPPDQAPTLFAEPGTPARSSLEVVGPGVGSLRPLLTADPVDARSELDSTVWIVLTAAFGAVAMSLFGGGLIAFIHQTRKSKLPAEARWVPPGWHG